MKKYALVALLVLAGCATASPPQEGTCTPVQVDVPVTEKVPAPPDIQEPAYVILTVSDDEIAAAAKGKSDVLVKKLLATITQLKGYSDELRKALDGYAAYSEAPNNISK